MKTSQPECQKFAARLIEAMLESGQKSQRKSQTGVTTLALREIAGVTNEMARRYTLGLAWPDNEKMAKIARWLGVRQAWLQYGESPKKLAQNINETVSLYNTDQLSALNVRQIELLQQCLSYALKLNADQNLQLGPDAQGKIAAVFFNHCLSQNIYPSDISEDLKIAVLSAVMPI